MKEYSHGMDAIVYFNFISNFSSFVKEVGERDHTNNFITNEIFPFMIT